MRKRGCLCTCLGPLALAFGKRDALAFRPCSDGFESALELSRDDIDRSFGRSQLAKLLDFLSRPATFAAPGLCGWRVRNGRQWATSWVLARLHARPREGRASSCCGFRARPPMTGPDRASAAGGWPTAARCRRTWRRASRLPRWLCCASWPMSTGTAAALAKVKPKDTDPRTERGLAELEAQVEMQQVVVALLQKAVANVTNAGVD